MKNKPNPNTIFPIPHIKTLTYVKPTIKNPNIIVGDTKIYYEVYGKGEPLLVLHGGGVGCTYEMGRFIDELSKDYMVIAPSTHTFGRKPLGWARPISIRRSDYFLKFVIFR